MDSVLILVHPGSACGSANFNLGKQAANAAREGLCIELQQWSGGVVVLDGDLSDELCDYPELRQQINDALHRAAARGATSIRCMANDPDQVAASQEIAQSLDPDTHFWVTGAWYQSSDGGGCAGSVLAALQALDRRVDLSDYVIDLDCDDEADCEEFTN